jgi:hypothetical protein
MTGSRVSVDKALVYRFVDQRYRRIKQACALLFVRARKSTPQAFDLRAKLASIAAIDQITLFVLTDPFFC